MTYEDSAYIWMSRKLKNLHIENKSIYNENKHKTTFFKKLKNIKMIFTPWFPVNFSDSNFPKVPNSPRFVFCRWMYHRVLTHGRYVARTHGYLPSHRALPLPFGNHFPSRSKQKSELAWASWFWNGPIRGGREGRKEVEGVDDSGEGEGPNTSFKISK